MRTFEKVWTDYVGETKHSPPIEEGDFSWIEEVGYRYAKEVQEAQIKVTSEDCINTILAKDPEDVPDNWRRVLK